MKYYSKSIRINYLEICACLFTELVHTFITCSYVRNTERSNLEWSEFFKVCLSRITFSTPKISNFYYNYSTKLRRKCYTQKSIVKLKIVFYLIYTLVVPGCGAKLYDARYYGDDFELRSEQTNSTLKEPVYKAFARFFYVIC